MQSVGVASHAIATFVAHMCTLFGLPDELAGSLLAQVNAGAAPISGGQGARGRGRGASVTSKGP
jgi:hypothetical protein